MTNLLTALIFFAPVGIANSSPVWMMKLPGLKKINYPLDFGIEIRGKRLFGKNKTWRGLVVGILTAIFAWWLLASYLDGLDPDSGLGLAYQPLSRVNTLVFGALAGFGAILGDAVESMVKRQLDRPPGAMFFPWDQTDYLFGAILTTLPVVTLPGAVIAWVFAAGVSLHLIANLLAYAVGIKDVPY